MEEIEDFDKLWLKRGQELVKESFTNLNRRLTNYNTFLDVLIAFYTTFGLTTTLLFQSVKPYTYIGFFLPLILVYWARYKISVGQSIPLESLDLRSPIKINDTHNKLLANLKKDILIAKKWVGIATFAVLVGGSVTTYFLNVEKRVIKVEKEKQIKTGVDSIKIRAEIKKEFDEAFNQKLNVAIKTDSQKITINGKLLEAKTYTVEYLDSEDGIIKTPTIEIPKYVDFKQEINNVEKLIDIK